MYPHLTSTELLPSNISCFWCGQMQVMPESWIENCIVKHRRMMVVLTTLALSVSITGKSSLSSSSISLFCCSQRAWVCLHFVFWSETWQHQTEQNYKFIFLVFLSPSLSLSPSKFNACFVKLRKAKMFDQTIRDPNTTNTNTTYWTTNISQSLN